MTNHALARIQERYGKTLCHKELKHIENCLNKGFGVNIGDGMMPNTKIVLIMYDHIPYKFVHEPSKRKIITALPLDINEANSFLDELNNIESVNPQRNNLADSIYIENMFKKEHQKFNFEKKSDVKHIFVRDIRVNIFGKRGNMILFWYKKDYKTIIYFIRVICQLEDELLEILKPYLHSSNFEKIKKVENFINRIIKA